MAIARTVRNYLEANAISPEIVRHSHTGSSAETAEAAHVSGHRIAKGIVLKSGGEHVLVVVPASDNVALSSVEDQYGSPLTLTDEDELSALFQDCEKGAVPAVGMAYDLPTYVDESLFDEPEVYFEGGDHESLIKLGNDEFRSLFADATTGRFGQSET